MDRCFRSTAAQKGRQTNHTNPDGGVVYALHSSPRSRRPSYDRSDIDDFNLISVISSVQISALTCPRPLLNHVRRARLHHRHHPEDIHVERLAKSRHADLYHWCNTTLPCIVDQDVDPSCFAHDLSDPCGDGRLAVDIELDPVDLFWQALGLGQIPRGSKDRVAAGQKLLAEVEACSRPR